MVSGRRHVGVLLAVTLALALGSAASAEAYVYWTNTSGYAVAIGRAGLDGTGANQSFVTVPGSSWGVAVDGSHIYWSNWATDTIGRAGLDGTGANQSFITGVSGPYGVAVDGSHVYWSAWTTPGVVGRANLDGSAANQSFISGYTALPAGVAVNGTHVYRTDFSLGVGTIERAGLDGGALNQTFITGASSPYAVAVDAAHLYWTNSSTGTIGRANLDGTGADQSFITGASGPYGVAVDATHVYWTNSGTGTIGRANLDGTGADQSFITGAHSPYGVAVDALSPLPSTTSPTGTPPSVTPPLVAPPASDTTAPVVSLSVKRTQKTGKLITIVVRCPNEACTVTASGTLNVPGTKTVKHFKLRKATKRIAKGARATLRLVISRNAQNAIKRALKKVTVRITITTRDAAGNTTTTRRTITLRT